MEVTDIKHEATRPAGMRPEFLRVRDACACLHRACQAVRLYPPGHLVARQAMEELHENLASYFSTESELSLETKETAFLFEGEEVYSYPGLNDNLAFVLFRDGIRSINVYSGIERPEVEALIDALAYADNLESGDQDMVTTLWEHDLVHVDYRVADPFLMGEFLQEGTVADLRQIVLDRLTELENATLQPLEGSDQSGAWLSSISAELPEALLAGLLETEREAVHAEGDPAALRDFGLVLLEIADSAELPGKSETVAGAFAALITSHLRSRDPAASKMLVQELAKIESNNLHHRGLVDQVLHQALDDATLGMLIHSLPTISREDQAAVEVFLLQARDWIAPKLLKMLEDANDRIVRRSLLNVLIQGDGVPLNLVLPAMSDPRWYVVRNMVIVASASRDPAAASYLVRLLRHADARVRREAVRALGARAEADTLPSLATCLGDTDDGVRILAANAVGRLGGPEHLERLAERAAGKDFSGTSAEEAEAFLMAMARAGGEAAVPLLEGIWRKRTMFKSQPAHIRVAALRALESIGSPSALESLARASRGGGETLRREASRSLLHFQGS